MCIIVDANVLGNFLSDPADEDTKPIRKWLDRGWGRIVYSTGGTFASEIKGAARERLAVYVRDGRAASIPADRFEERKRALEGRIQSDDPHVLALALEAKVRLLYTKDKQLIADFTDKKIIDRPRGKVYSSRRNSHLLTSTACAGK